MGNDARGRQIRRAVERLDVQAFWGENTECLRRTDGTAPRVALVLIFEEFFLLDMLGDVDGIRYYRDLLYRHSQHIRANDVLEREIARFEEGGDSEEEIRKRMQGLGYIS